MFICAILNTIDTFNVGRTFLIRARVRELTVVYFSKNNLLFGTRNVLSTLHFFREYICNGTLNFQFMIKSHQANSMLKLFYDNKTRANKNKKQIIRKIIICVMLLTTRMLFSFRNFINESVIIIGFSIV